MIYLKDETHPLINQRVKIENVNNQVTDEENDWLQEVKQKMVELFSAMTWNG